MSGFQEKKVRFQESVLNVSLLIGTGHGGKVKTISQDQQGKVSDNETTPEII